MLYESRNNRLLNKIQLSPLRMVSSTKAEESLFDFNDRALRRRATSPEPVSRVTRIRGAQLSTFVPPRHRGGWGLAAGRTSKVSGPRRSLALEKARRRKKHYKQKSAWLGSGDRIRWLVSLAEWYTAVEVFDPEDQVRFLPPQDKGAF